MIELKTLKDLNGIGYGLKQGFYSDSFMIDSHKLRQEVIKWIKELTSGNNIQWKEDHPFYLFRHDIYPIIDFIQDRFNITDDDLK